jgi:hypothetical protein
MLWMTQNADGIEVGPKVHKMATKIIDPSKSPRHVSTNFASSIRSNGYARQTPSDYGDNVRRSYITNDYTVTVRRRSHATSVVFASKIEVKMIVVTLFRQTVPPLVSIVSRQTRRFVCLAAEAVDDA